MILGYPLNNENLIGYWILCLIVYRIRVLIIIERGIELRVSKWTTVHVEPVLKQDTQIPPILRVLVFFNMTRDDSFQNIYIVHPYKIK